MSRTRSIRMKGADGGQPCPSAEDAFTQTKVCNANIKCNPPCNPSDWSKWSTCSKTCGGGVKVHTRTINPPPGVPIDKCPSGKEFVPCNTNECPVNCVEGDWLPWSDCSEPCAGGVAQRRKKIVVAAAFGGTQCKALVDDRECNLQECPIDCKVLKWSEFGKCSVTCGKGVKKRFRRFVEPLYGGKRCPHNEEKEVCDLDPCPQDCELSAWADWKKCSEPCAGGKTWRARRVLLKEEFGGVPCARGGKMPEMLQNKTCNEQPCPVECALSSWGNWSSCSVSCGNGTSARTRKVLQEAQHGAEDCPATKESRECREVDCPRDCQVTPWNTWSVCSSVCQGGTQQRTRKLIKPEAMGGITCPTLLDERKCNEDKPCAQSCVIGSWSEWSGCSQKCGSGIRTRDRVMKEPVAGGSQCPHKEEKEVCNVDLCPFAIELVSQDKPATQSSEYGSAPAARAVDGDNNGDFSSDTCTQTQKQKNAWWKVDLQQEVHIQKVVVWNRVDCCKERLGGFSVKLCCPWEECGTAKGDEAQSTTVHCNFLKGRYVQVELEGEDYLTLCEVQVFGSTQHPPFSSLVSVGMPASQTTEGWGGEARKAVDGKTDGIYDDQSCTHTEKKANNWWKVDLQAEYFVSKVIVWNRVDCCSERLAGFTVSLCCPTIECKGESGGLETAVDCHHEKGRYVQVTLARDDFLTLCEVQVFGTKVGSLPNIRLISQGMPASQSSEDADGAPSRAVDGKTDGKYSMNSCTHTKTESNAWWKVDFQNEYKIDKVVVWNRSDCCASRLNGFVVKLCCPWKTCGTGGGNNRNEVQCFDQTGRYLQIELEKSDYLVLCEVQVYGTRAA